MNINLSELQEIMEESIHIFSNRATTMINEVIGNDFDLTRYKTEHIKLLIEYLRKLEKRYYNNIFFDNEENGRLIRRAYASFDDLISTSESLEYVIASEETVERYTFDSTITTTITIKKIKI